MISKKVLFSSIAAIGLSAGIYANPVNVQAASSNLQKGSKGTAVTTLQNNLRQAGYFNLKSTGYFGSVTQSSVLKLQKKYGLKADGIVGPKTYKAINDALSRDGAAMTSSKPTEKVAASATNNLTVMKTSDFTSDSETKPAPKISSRAEYERGGSLIPWFGGVEDIFARETEAVVFDIDTGLSFKVLRSYGYNHADCEPLTKKDTDILKSIYGDQWSWNRRAVIVTIDGIKIPASMAGMPHAGLDSEPVNANVSYRSGGYGTGLNLDMVKNNGMDGHFDIHFYNSKTHGSNKVDANHQKMVSKAFQWLEGNF
ncbi:MAG TPA: peptidoglycan-binding domain-containing protein [Pseudobacteroides sp.]|uniref:peptidoglycan-binding domain-containing protein n=1 Tax=Pseudobacteroides sp. TaxID=1968840 RepID=UPI002F92C5E8